MSDVYPYDAQQRAASAAAAASSTPFVPAEAPAGERVSVDEVTSEPSVPPTLRAGVVRSDMHCPLLTEPEAIDRRTVVEYDSDAVGTQFVREVHRYPEQVVADPVYCPTCAKVLERHQLVWDNGSGERDCAIALKMRRQGRDVEALVSSIRARVSAVADAPEPAVPVASEPPAS